MKKELKCDVCSRNQADGDCIKVSGKYKMNLCTRHYSQMQNTTRY